MASGNDGRYAHKPGRRELEQMFIFLRDKYLMMSTPEHKAEPVMVKTGGQVEVKREGHAMVKTEKQVKRCCVYLSRCGDNTCIHVRKVMEN